MEEVDYKAALGLALRRIETSDRFESEVRDALRRYSPDIVDRVVAYLHEKRFLNDSRTLDQAVERNAGRRALGDALLKERLVRRGADEAMVEARLAETGSEAERIDALLAAKYQPHDDPARAGRFLYGRGFSEDAIREALERYFVHREDA